MTPNWPARSLAETYAILTAPGGPFEMREEEIGGVTLRTYVRAPATLRTVFERSALWPERTYLVFQGERVTFAAHRRAVAQLAAAFGARFGIAKGDRVAIAMRNLPEWVVAFWATVACGAVVVPVNAWGGTADIAYAVRDCGAKLLLVDAERLERVAGAIDEVAIVAARTPPEQLGAAVAMESLIGTAADWAGLPELPLPEPDLAPDDDATIFYTSGTTGAPKGALGTHRAITTNLVNVGLRVARATLRRGGTLPPPDTLPGPRTTLLPTPLFHVTGTHSGIVPAMWAGTTIVLMYKWDPAAALRLVEEERVNTIVTVPTMSWQLADPALPLDRDLSSLDTITYGGAPGSADLHDALHARFPNLFTANGFGMTETSSVVSSNSGEDMARHPDSVGTAMPCNDLRVIGEDGRDVPPGAPGELVVRGPNVIKEYWHRPRETAEAMQDGWLKTGDIVRIDEEGFIFALDRSKDMIIRGGENIYCLEVEEALLRHPGVAEAAVIGVPDVVLGETVGAVVRTRDGVEVDDAALDAFARGRLAAFKVPLRYFRTTEGLPRNVAGKVLKRQLKAQFITG